MSADQIRFADGLPFGDLLTKVDEFKLNTDSIIYTV